MLTASNRIVLDPGRFFTAGPVIRGTRIPVAAVVGSLAAGMTFEEVQGGYDLSVDDIRAALRFAAKLAHGSIRRRGQLLLLLLSPLSH
jgi:uncharacterized protein (DUF433 family)